jgi:hypothetical protein
MSELVAEGVAMVVGRGWCEEEEGGGKEIIGDSVEEGEARVTGVLGRVEERGDEGEARSRKGTRTGCEEDEGM